MARSHPYRRARKTRQISYSGTLAPSRFTETVIATGIIFLTTVVILATALWLEPRPNRYELAYEIYGERYVEDHNLTLGDCFDAMRQAQNDTARGSWACEIAD